MVIVILTGWGVAVGCVLFARLLMFVSFWMFTLVFGFGGSLVFGVDLLLLVGVVLLGWVWVVWLLFWCIWMFLFVWWRWFLCVCGY